MNIFRLFVSLVFAASAAVPAVSLAGQTNNFYGEVVHVSTENVKVMNPKSHETISFVLTPKFDQVFSDNGKTTYQMKDLRTGQYVRVVYDQKALGMRHADKIYILNNANMKTGNQIPSQIH